MSSSERLRRKTELLAPELATPGRLLLQHPRARKLVPAYLTVSYDLARTTVPLLEAALTPAQTLPPQDAVAAPLAKYLERHIAEEKHGDETGGGGAMREDLEALGVTSARERPPSEKVAALIGQQYFLALHYHPVSVLGFLQLEHYHPQRDAVERLIQATGLPREGFAQMLLHAEIDVAHSTELDILLDSLPLTREQEELIGVSALDTIARLIDALLDVVQDGSRAHAATTPPAAVTSAKRSHPPSG